MSVQRFDNDDEYFGWVALNRSGYILSLRPRGPLLHRATCTHIDRHRNAGALTERGVAKLCAASKQELRDYARRHNLITGVVLDKCPSCGP
jgi:hypothetical protein